MKPIIDLSILLTKKPYTAALIGVLCLLAFQGASAHADSESMSLAVNGQDLYRDAGGGIYHVFSSPVLTNVTGSGNPRLAGDHVDPGAYEGTAIEVPDAETLAKIGVEQDYPLDGNYIQTADIDLAGYLETSEWTPIGKTQHIAFVGTFNGNGYTIRNLKLALDNLAGEDIMGVGLFGVVGTGGRLTNIRLLDVEVTGRTNTGGLVGNLQDGGTVEQAYVRGTVRGLGGETVRGADDEVDGETGNIGGLVGINAGGIIRNSAAFVHMQGWAYVGGLVGNNNGTIRNAYAIGNVVGDRYVGGLVGYSTDLMGLESILENTYASGSVTGNNDIERNHVGGLIGRGYLEETMVVASYWNKTTSEIDGSPDDLGRDDIEMRKQETFTDWDFTDIWAIDEGISQPYLRWYGNPVPQATTSSGTATFTESTQGDPVPVAVDPELTVSDADDTALVSATVAIVANFQPEQDPAGLRERQRNGQHHRHLRWEYRCPDPDRFRCRDTGSMGDSPACGDV